MSSLRTHVTFRSTAFNTSASRDYFINPTCFGDDLLTWLRQELSERRVRSGGPEQEDFGWHLSLTVDDKEYDFVVGYRAGEADVEGDWFCWLERKAGLVGSLLGARRRGIEGAAVELIHSVLSSSAA